MRRHPKYCFTVDVVCNHCGVPVESYPFDDALSHSKMESDLGSHQCEEGKDCEEVA